MDWINFQHFLDKDLVSDLFATYTNNFGKISRFYSGNYSDTADWRKKITTIERNRYNRSLLQRVLNTQNRDFNSGIKTLANIDLLGNDNTFAVVTGQQLGICTGPLYTMYKAMTAVKLSQQLANQYPEYNFVPVFWLEGEDHDFDEINKVKFINTTNEFSSVEYLLEGKPLEKNPGPTGAIIIDDTISPFFDAIQSAMTPTEFSEGVLEAARGYYKKGNTLLQAFTGFFNHIYDDSGIIFVNPNHPELKQEVSPLFLKEIQSTSETSKRVIQMSAELEEQYHAQIKAKAVNLFMFHKGGRYLIEPSENGDYFLRNTRQRFTKDELTALCRSTPEVFSPNVVLRPLVQDTLFPTIAYVGGPSEIAYFAQLKPVYELFDVTMPIIYPRMSISVVEEKVNRVLEKYSLEVHDLFGDIDAVLAKVSEQVSEVKVDELFARLETHLREHLNEARFGIQQIDPTLNGSIDSTLQKFIQQLDVLKHKTRRAQVQKEEISLKQIRKAALHVFPNGNFQEREITVLHYLNKYGIDFIRWIEGESSLEKQQHQIITIE